MALACKAGVDYFASLVPRNSHPTSDCFYPPRVSCYLDLLKDVEKNGGGLDLSTSDDEVEPIAGAPRESSATATTRIPPSLTPKSGVFPSIADEGILLMRWLAYERPQPKRSSPNYYVPTNIDASRPMNDCPKLHLRLLAKNTVLTVMDGIYATTKISKGGGGQEMKQRYFKNVKFD
uniref:Uncharacterized protein n=1 Tax=Asparagus officinalis TaxID=4686 RepID=Q2AA04_ASPOF|nr:hypothetical protein 20.t00048 [Asparagus officinalis]